MARELTTASPSEVRHANANRLARRREKLSAHYCLNPSSAVSVRLEQLSIACSHGRPKVLFQRLARDGALNRTLADVSIENDETAVTGNNGVEGNSNVHDCNSGGLYRQLTWKFVRRRSDGRASRKAPSQTGEIRCTTRANGPDGEAEDGEAEYGAAQGRAGYRDACQRTTPPGQRTRPG